MTFSPMMLLGIAPKLADLLRVGIEHYGDLRAQGGEVTADGIALYLAIRAESWDPLIAGKHALDEATRIAMCRFLAGVAFNLCSR